LQAIKQEEACRQTPSNPLWDRKGKISTHLKAHKDKFL